MSLSEFGCKSSPYLALIWQALALDTASPVPGHSQMESLATKRGPREADTGPSFQKGLTGTSGFQKKEVNVTTGPVGYCTQMKIVILQTEFLRVLGRRQQILG
jgi:hypothetical protein